jgi:transcription antitermination factor NusG
MHESMCFHPGTMFSFDESLCFGRCVSVNIHPNDDEATMGSFEQRGVRQEVSFLANCSSELRFDPKWFAVYTISRHEKRVAQHLTQREIEYYLPLYRSQRKWSDGSRVTLELPLFPGYLFVRIKKTERVRVLDVPGALAVVGGTGREPVALPDDAIDALRTGLHLRRAEPHPLLTVGQRARIRSGALAGMEGVVVRMKNSLRVVLTLEHIQRSIAVEVGSDDLEPMASGALSAAYPARA